jgi:hypothetical protein
MGRKPIFFFIMIVFVCISGTTAYAFEFGIDAWAGNIGFRTDRASTDTSYPGVDYFWGGSLFAVQPITEDMRFTGGYLMDPILRNVVFGLLTYTQKSLTIGVGPFMGVFNDFGMPLKSGISILLKIELPGILFASLQSDNTIGGNLQLSGDYLQERNDITFGFYVRNAICSLGMNTKKFTQLIGATRVIDASTSYAFKADIFQKNVPYRIGINLAYQSISKTYIDTVTVSDILNTLIAGTKLDILFSESFFMYAGIDANLFSFGQGQLTGGTTAAFLFSATLGFKVNLDTTKGFTSIF